MRRQRLTAPAIARRPGRPVSTVGLVLHRLGLGRLEALEPEPPVIRHERDRPGGLIHVDVEKPGRIEGIGHRIAGDRRGRKRGIGREYLHVCVDDASRLAYTPSPCPTSAWRVRRPSCPVSSPSSRARASPSDG